MHSFRIPLAVVASLDRLLPGPYNLRPARSHSTPDKNNSVNRGHVAIARQTSGPGIVMVPGAQGKQRDQEEQSDEDGPSDD